jgi:hypothetical protein
MNEQEKEYVDSFYIKPPEFKDVPIYSFQNDKINQKKRKQKELIDEL